ncbi:MAG: SusC/RagA family TonB-linked outer membrane protein [Marinifilaceae bacterium]
MIHATNFFRQKLKALLCFVLCIISLAVGAERKQHLTVTLKMNNVSLVEVLDKLEELSGMSFLYNAQVINNVDKIDIRAINEHLTDVLNTLLPPRGLSYVKNKEQIVIRQEEKIEEDTPKHYVVKGLVTDKKAVTLPGATVRIDGSAIGTVTNDKGEFSMVVTKPKGYLIVSFVGYKEQKIPYELDKPFVAKMEEEVSNLDEVTVIAYGHRKKRELISSISSVKADDIKEMPVPSLETLLQGRMAGLGVQQQSGAPGGGGTTVAIRGYNSLLDDESGYKNDGSPLYVIDGIPVHSFTSPITGTNTIAEIDPSTIESVEVLKDAASAAIYGSRAANGVILITTKKGRAGEGKFSANVSYTGAVLPETPLQVGGRAERAYLLSIMKAARSAYYDKTTGEWRYPTSMEEAADNDAIYDKFWNNGMGLGTSGNEELHDSLNPFYNNSTNWFKYIFRPGKIINANLQTSGGNEKITYLIGGGIYKEIGIMPGSDFIRGNLITNFSVRPKERLSIDSRIYLAYTDRSRGVGGTGGGKFESLTITPEYASTVTSAGGAVEQKLLQKLNGQVESNTSYRLRGNLVLGYELFDGFNISVSGGLDYNQVNQNFFMPSYLEPTYKESKSSGEVGRDVMLTNENILNYNFTLNRNHNFDLLAGLSMDLSKQWSIGGYGLGGPSDYIHYVGNNFPDMIYSPIADEYRVMQKYQSDFTETAMVSYFGRIAYNYDKRYLMEATFRRDGSSVFGADVRWATFPSVAAGWAFSEERFMRRMWWMDYAKLRASWGRTGSQFGIPYLAQGLMQPGGIFDGVQGMTPSGVVNRKLKWEEADQYDFGLDLDFFEYRLGLTIDYYYKYTRSLIDRVPLPGDVNGEANIQWRNAMAVSNEGLEIEAKYDILRGKAVDWRMRFNMSFNRNKFCKSYSGVDTPGKVIGKAVNGIYLFMDEGIIQSEKDVPHIYDEEGKKQNLSPGGDEQYFYTMGMRKIADLDGDGQITEDDMYYAGSSLPKVHGGLSSEIKWKNFDMTFLFIYTLGRKMVNAFSTRSLISESYLKPVFEDVTKDIFWEKPGDDAQYPALGIYPVGAMQLNGLYSSNLEKVNFLKLKQLTVGYNLHLAVCKKLRLDGVRFFVTGENLLSFTNYSGVDPELVSIYSGIDDANAYPLARKWTAGLTINF